MAQFNFHDEVLSLLLTDDAAAKRLTSVLQTYQFPQEVQKNVCTRLLQFAHEFGAAAKAHAYELVEKDDQEYLQKLFDLGPGIHRDYVLGRLDQFLREGNIRKTITGALDALQMSEWDKIENLFSQHSRTGSTFFDAGIQLKGDSLIELLTEDPPDEGMLFGIKPLDEAHLIASPGTLTIFIAPAKRGKSWFLIHCAVQAILQRKSVLYVTLEMSRKKIGRRMLQKILAATKRQIEPFDVTRFDHDATGRINGFISEKLERPALDMKLLKKAEAALTHRSRLYIKEFPTGTPTVADLRAYLDGLEQAEHFVPDVLIVDYADLMKLDSANLRVDTSMLYKDLRGIASERGMACITASQSNRSSADARWVREGMVAEDWSKIATADTVFTYSQTPEEKLLNLARIFVSNARDEEDKWALTMSQAYKMGQFCLEAERLGNDEVYWSLMEEAHGQRQGANQTPDT